MSKLKIELIEEHRVEGDNRIVDPRQEILRVFASAVE
jgi:hypothetical protein